MKRLEDNGIVLLTYKEAKRKIGIYRCDGKEIDDDTVIVYKKFYEDIQRTGSLAKEHEVDILWLCTAHIFCKCGEYHHIRSEYPVEYQLREIIVDIYGQTGITFCLPDEDIVPDGCLIIPDIKSRKEKKLIKDVNKWV